jgi:ABC-2 type transport system ATP-binding protein
MKTEPVLEMEGLTVRYGRVTAVNDLSLRVPRGGVFALLGRNGSGKSSTVRCLLGQRRAAAGSCRIFGLDTWKNREELMVRVGVVPEHPDIPPESHADHLARFMVRVAPRWSSQSFFDRLEGFGVPRRRPFRKLSKGQQRQTALALALAHSPEVLVLDDPTLGLDAVARRELFEELIGDLADHGTTVFLTTHDLAGVEGIADQVGVLKNGALLVDESLESLKVRFCRLTMALQESDSKEEVEKALRHLGPISAGGLGGTYEAVVDSFSEVGFGKFREEARVEVSRVQSLALEEIFIALCGENGGGR